MYRAACVSFYPNTGVIRVEMPYETAFQIKWTNIPSKGMLGLGL